MSEKTNQETTSTRIDFLSKVLKLLREGIIIVVLILLLLMPSTFNGILTNAGFTEADIAGFHWEKELQEANERTQEALQAVEQVNTDSEKLEKTIEAIRLRTDDPVVKREVDILLMDVKEMQAQVRTVDTSLQENLQKEQMLLEQIQRPKLQRTVPEK